MIHAPGSAVKKKEMRRPQPPHLFLLLAEGLTVGALIHGGICLMGTHQNPLQRTVVCAVAVVGALADSTLDGLICMIVHDVILLFLISKLVCPRFQNSIQEKSVNIAFYQQM